MKYEVLTYTLCDGYINCWTTWHTSNPDPVPHTFDSREEAQAEIDEFMADIQAEIESGERGADEGYDRDDFVIVAVGEQYIDPAAATLMSLLTKGDAK